jgi:hypothetical protein
MAARFHAVVERNSSLLSNFMQLSNLTVDSVDDARRCFNALTDGG